MVEIWVSQPLNPSSYGIFHSLKWVMTDHLCITKMGDYLQWIHSFLYKLVISGRKHSFYFFFSLKEYFGHYGQFANLSIQYPIYYITMKSSEIKEKASYMASLQSIDNHVLHSWCTFNNLLSCLETKKKLTPLATTAPKQLRSDLQTSFKTWDLKVTF